MTLNAPRVLFFIISVAIAIIAVVAKYIAGVSIPIDDFWLMTIAFVILALSCVIRGM